MRATNGTRPNGVTINHCKCFKIWTFKRQAPRFHEVNEIAANEHKGFVRALGAAAPTSWEFQISLQPQQIQLQLQRFCWMIVGMRWVTIPWQTLEIPIAMPPLRHFLFKIFLCSYVDVCSHEIRFMISGLHSRSWACRETEQGILHAHELAAKLNKEFYRLQIFLHDFSKKRFRSQAISCDGAVVIEV